MKIADLLVNTNVKVTLAIKTVRTAKTKAPKNKPYLDFILTDGIDSIPAKYWDWNGQHVPPTDKVRLSGNCG